MKLNKHILFVISGSLVAGMAVLSNYSNPVQSPLAGHETQKEDEEEGEHDARGAYESFYSMKLNEVTGTVEPEWVQAAVDQANKLRLSSRAAKPINWVNMGPDNVGGRIRAFLMHRDSNHLMFAGSVSGGLFRSNTNGLSWYPVNDMQENLSVNCIAQTPDGTIYYGTGEGGFTNLSGTRNGSPAFIGAGVFKSTDNRGTVFNKIPATNTAAYMQCNAMVAHPTENYLFVATESGVYRTSNGGASFTMVRGGAIRDMVIDKDGIVWCSSSGGAIFKGNADGTSFAQVNNGIAPGGRTALAISPEDPQYVYALGSSGGALSGVWRSTNAGQNWELIVGSSTVTNIFGSNNQGWYDNVIAVDPINKNHIYMGGVVLAEWDNKDGFREIASTFSAPWNNGYIHADKHVIQFNMKTNPATMIVGTDGGLFSSQNRTVWTDMNRGFTTYQCYNIAANYLGHVVGGSQDNGNYLINFTGNSFNGQPSKTGIHIGPQADGFDAEFSRFKPQTIFVSMQNGPVYRTANSGQSVSTFWDLRQDGKTPSDFNTTYTLWESDEKTSMLWLAKNQDIWVAINPTDFSQAVNWFLVGSSLGSDRIIEMDHTPDGDHLFACKQGKLYRFDSLQSATYSISLYPGSRDIPKPIKKTLITPSALGGRTITSVNVDQADPNHVVVTAGGYGNTSYVFETNNGLDDVPVWINITGNLPLMPVYDAVVDVDDPNRIIIGTELGVWLTENGGTTWEEANTGMARVPVYEIRGYEFNSWEGMALYVGTHGRGYFKSSSLLTSTKKIRSNQASTAKGYPNPAKEMISISYEAGKAGNAVVEIYNVKGDKVASFTNNGVFGSNEVKVNVSAYTPGYYFARVVQGSSVSTVKFAVTR